MRDESLIGHETQPETRTITAAAPSPRLSVRLPLPMRQDDVWRAQTLYRK